MDATRLTHSPNGGSRLNIHLSVCVMTRVPPAQSLSGWAMAMLARWFALRSNFCRVLLRGRGCDRRIDQAIHLGTSRLPAVAHARE